VRNAYLPIFMLSCWMLSVTSHADTEQPKVRLGPHVGALKVRPGMDASGLDLYGTEIVGQDLTEANFGNARLRGCRIVDCTLTNASFKGADLHGFRIFDCRIQGADFSDAVVNGILGSLGMPGEHDILHLSQTVLETTASFKRKDLSNCGILGPNAGGFYDFRGFNLRGSRLKGDFSRSKFAGARIHKASFLGIFPFKELRKTIDFEQRSVLGCVFSCGKPLDLSGIFLKDSEVNINDAANYNLEGATLYCCRVIFRQSSASAVLPTTKSYQEGNLTGNAFSYSDMSGLNFDRMNLTSCKFDGCDLTDTTFNDAVVSRADFRETTGLTVEQIKSTWNYKHGRMAGITLPEGIAKALADK